MIRWMISLIRSIHHQINQHDSKVEEVLRDVSTSSTLPSLLFNFTKLLTKEYLPDWIWLAAGLSSGDVKMEDVNVLLRPRENNCNTSIR